MGAIRVSVMLLQYTCSLSISARQSRKGVSAFIIWKSTRLIGVLTLTNLINAVKLMLNLTFIALVCVVLISVLLFVALYARYCPQPMVDFLKAPMSIITLQNSLGVQCSVVIYVNGSCLWSVMSVTDLAGVFINWFSGVIKCTKKWLASAVIVLKAQLSVRGLKVVKNISKVFCSWAFKLKLIIRAFINLLGGFSASSSLYFRMNWLIQLLSLFLNLSRSSQVYLVDQYPFLLYMKYFWLVRLRGYVFIQGLLRGLQGLNQYRCCQQ